MRLLVDCHVFDGKFQGTRTYIQGLYTSLIRYSDIDFFFAARDINNLKSIFGEASNVHYVEMKSNNSFTRLLFEIPQLINKNKIDYAHFQYIVPWKKTCKEIVTIHDLIFMEYPSFFPWYYRFSKNFFFKRSAKRADILLTVSCFSRKEIHSIYKIPIERIHVTPNAVLNDFEYSRRSTELIGIDRYLNIDNSKILLSVSRIEPRKNHLSLLKAFVELELYKKGYKLILIGKMDMKYKDFSLFLSNLSKDVRKNILIQTVPFPVLLELYKRASLFVFPSYAEGFGIPPLEAVEVGCPLLCSKATAMLEFNLPESIMFDPYDLEELKRKIVNELRSPTDLNNVRKIIMNKYNWGTISEKYYNILMKYGNEIL